jgi:hypothetical protein
MLAVLVVVATALALSAQTDDEVDLNLVLAVDCSWSVDSGEFALQMQGVAEAIGSPEVLTAIEAGPNRRVAIAVLQWSAVNTQQVVVPWTIVADAASAAQLAREIALAPRLVNEGATSITSAIDAGLILHMSAPYRTQRRVIDISGDGVNNNGGAPDGARDRAVRRGIVINGLAILNEVFYLDTYYKNHVIGGSGAFVMHAEDYEAFRQAIKRKLLRELTMPTA